MTAPNPKKQKASIKIINSLFEDIGNVRVIHYSCESFIERPNGASPRITSIAVRKLDSAQTVSFSIHQIAEEQGVAFSDIEGLYDRLERNMLDAFFVYLSGHQGNKYIHWNMRDINYGFAAIEHRYRVLGGIPSILDDFKKFDLSRLLIDIYGVGYIGHPRLEKLLKRNNIRPLDFLSGSEEAEAFENRNYVALHRSTLRKVDVLANITERCHDKTLKTETTWWEMHGGNLRTFWLFIVDNKTLAFLLALVGTVLALLTL
jgi:hypothetical protein